MKFRIFVQYCFPYQAVTCQLIKSDAGWSYVQRAVMTLLFWEVTEYMMSKFY